MLASGVPASAHPFTGLVYRQALEHLNGVRDEAATRALIAQENRRYARRQMIWFRKEPNVHWLAHPGDHPEALEEALVQVDNPEMTLRMGRSLRSRSFAPAERPTHPEGRASA